MPIIGEGPTLKLYVTSKSTKNLLTSIHLFKATNIHGITVGRLSTFSELNHRSISNCYSSFNFHFDPEKVLNIKNRNIYNSDYTSNKQDDNG